MAHPTSLDYWTLAIAVVGSTTGIVALGAQVWAHVLSGPRVRVSVSNALRNASPFRWDLGLEVANLGRLPVTVVSFGVALGDERMPIGALDTSYWVGEPGPFRLVDADSTTWLVNANLVAAEAQQRNLRNVRGYVVLATGKTVVSRNRIDVVNLATLN